MKQDVGITNFKVYENANEFYGMAELTLPEISLQGDEVTGAGIAGAFTSAFAGHTQAMSLTLNFRAVSRSLVRLVEDRSHQITAMAAQQQRDNASGALTQQAVKYVFVGKPTKWNPGKLAPASAADSSVEFSITYLAVFIDGVNAVEIDQLNFIYKINGTDYLAAARRAIGMA
jgi:P2 family phage contractile tail tube protein